jgi:hypothetical protein
MRYDFLIVRLSKRGFSLTYFLQVLVQVHFFVFFSFLPRVSSLIQAADYKDFSQSHCRRPCSGTLTPWKTHIGGEENTPQSRGYPNLVWGQNLAATSKRGKPYSDSGLADQAKIHELTNPKDISPYW